MALRNALCVDYGELYLYENRVAAKPGSTLFEFFLFPDRQNALLFEARIDNVPNCVMLGSTFFDTILSSNRIFSRRNFYLP